MEKLLLSQTSEETKEEKRLRIKRESYARHKERNREKARINYHTRYKDNQKEKSRLYREENKEELKVYWRNYARANRQKKLESSRKSKLKRRLEKPELVKELNREEQRKHRFGRDKETIALIKRLRNNPCVYCGASPPSTIDHIIPVSKGGTHDLHNLTSACQSCNSSKNAKSLEEFLITDK